VIVIDDDTHKVQSGLLNKNETVLFIQFLKAENARHEDAIDDARIEIKYAKPPMSTFWETAIKRHRIDIRETTELINSLKEKWGIV